MRSKADKRSLLGWLMFIGLCAFSTKGHGEEVNRLKGTLQESPQRFNGEVQWETVGYLIALPETEHLNTSQFLSADFDYEVVTPGLRFGADVSAGTFVEFGSSTFTADELYIGTGSAYSDVEISFGRKRVSWNLLDQEWQLGLYQPIYNFDIIHPVDQGLTGIFFESNVGPLRMAARFSPLFIPSQGAPIENKDGELRAPTRFFHPPAASTILIGQPTTIEYNLEIASTEELIGHSGYSLLLGLGDPDENGAWGQVSFSDKPNPQLLINFVGQLSLTEEEDGRPQGDVTVSPYVSYHRVYSGDFGVTSGEYRAWVSVLADEPYGSLYDDEWTRQEISPLRAYAVQFSFPTWTIQGLAGSGDISYLEAQGTESKSANSTTDGEAALFGDRIPYKRAARFRLTSPIADIFDRPLSSRVKWLWDFEESGLLMSTELRYLYQDSVALLVGFDMIGTMGETEDSESSTFFSQYRSNDRVYGGLSYVF